MPHEDEMLLTKPPDSSAGAAARVLRTEQGPEAKQHRGTATEDKGPLDSCKHAINSEAMQCCPATRTKKNINQYQSVQSTPGLKAFDARRNCPRCGCSASETTVTAISSARGAHAASLVFCVGLRLVRGPFHAVVGDCRSDDRF